MPSPFPGMNPFLEGSLWMSVHTQLGVEIQRQLMPLLRPRYIALTQERFVIATADSEPDAGIYPDVSVADVGSGNALAAKGATVAAPLELATVMPEMIPHIFLEIRDVAERGLVTDIEILSPTNKRGEGRREYLTRRQRLLGSSAHLMEIDLLRSGQRVPMRKPLPPHPYFVFLSRQERRPMVEVWPISLKDSLPTVPVPLLAGDADVSLDLQKALSNVYDLAGYDLAVDYARLPDVELTPEDAEWAQDLLKRRDARKKRRGKN